ncbi:GLUCAN ENDO-13-BETA-GLUCOSIDASE BG1-RELATED-RELATED [Salix koriyanagi]|uniref:GLUCAN ENDO-13-BETA-GLUCOSIDASE BG1-RELATED-RELATED n=1 Tax=Salix koriyanagi TaxID=2511006 RepID=A0A9Q0P6G5_9ROSI|nr:GLUCAN ENDO-13-BETA-GLUCOSIDASE BG1-RELATED-RELATED [Salix koriyanagi]
MYDQLAIGIGVGNEPFLSSFNSTYGNVTFTFPALQDVHGGVGDKIKATETLNADVDESSSNELSDSNFRNNVKDVMFHTDVSSSK